MKKVENAKVKTNLEEMERRGYGIEERSVWEFKKEKEEE